MKPLHSIAVALQRLVRHPGNPRNKCKCGHVLGSHGQDLSWARCGTTACRHRHCDCQKFESPNAPGSATEAAHE